jgi:acetoacetyl-CoA synthetase
MGTAEFYSVVEELPEVADSLVVDTGELLLFVVPAQGVAFDEQLERRLRTAIRTGLSPRHVPDRIVAVPAVPRTLNGKKCEVPVKKILSGIPVDKAVARDSLADPGSLEPFVALAAPAT